MTSFFTTSLLLVLASLLPSALAGPSQNTTFSLSPGSDANLCIVPSGDSEGSSVIVTDCDSSDDIAWTYQGTSLVHSATGKCMDITNGEQQSGNIAQIWGCYAGNTNQMFDFSGDHIKWSNKFCLDLTDGADEEGTKVQIWSCWNWNSNQVWTIGQVEEVDGCGDCESSDTSTFTAGTSSAFNVTASSTDSVAASDTLGSATASETSGSATASETPIGGGLWANGSTSRKHRYSTSATCDSWATSSVTASHSKSSSKSSDSWSSSTSSAGAASSSAAVSTTGSGSTSGYLQTSGSKVVDSSGNDVVMKGVNIGGWLVLEDWMCGISDSSGNADRFAQTTLETRFGASKTATLLSAWQDNYLVSEDFDNIKTMGFNLLRIPFSYLTLQNSDGTWKTDSSGNVDFTKLDWAIAQAKSRGLWVVLVFHIWETQDQSYSLISENSDAGQAARDKAKIIWETVGKHYLGESTIAAFDAINEPTGSWGNLLQQDLYDAIRSVDSKRIIIMESISTNPTTYGWTNVMYSMHEYLMMGDDLSSNEATYKTSTGSDISTWTNMDIPVYIGEFMAHTTTLAWYLEQLDNSKVWWSMWTYSGVNVGGWATYNYQGVSVDVGSDSYDSILSQWNSLGTKVANTDLISAYTTATGGSSPSRKRSTVKFTQRAREGKRVWGGKHAGRSKRHGKLVGGTSF
ncbi:glycoside hydrolase superfamily [Naematelia encephala]|uniref:Glycoside hydrolase superfamily n=1 Tax=Naematelia encephala TaxID=71784 RepID=A0A1Y2BM74_9TREE|nr:glycoside hydrolase superfamily [Naematelia encephala]